MRISGLIVTPSIVTLSSYTYAVWLLCGTSSCCVLLLCISLRLSVLLPCLANKRVHTDLYPHRSFSYKGKSSPYSITERIGFRSWSRCLAVSLQVTWVINPAVGCHYFPPGLQLPPQPLRWLLPLSLLGEQRHSGCEQFVEDCYPTASRLRFEPGPFCAWVHHAKHSATEPPSFRIASLISPALTGQRNAVMCILYLRSYICRITSKSAPVFVLVIPVITTTSRLGFSQVVGYDKCCPCCHIKARSSVWRPIKAHVANTFTLRASGRIACLAHMRPIATDGVAWSVCMCLCVDHDPEPSRNGWTDRNAVGGIPVWTRETPRRPDKYDRSVCVRWCVLSTAFAVTEMSSRQSQSCPWVELTHGLDWVGLGWVDIFQFLVG